MDILKIFKTKINQDQLHNLYIINPSVEVETQKLLNWSFELFSDFTKTKALENHPDFLIIKAQDKTKQYSKEILEEILKFTQYEATELKRKYLIFDQAHFLSEYHLNKLLKTFEEPPVALSTIILNPMLSKLIGTITSRAIHYRVQLKQDQSPTGTINFEQSFANFYQEVIKNNYTIDFVYSQTLNHILSSQIGHTKSTEIKSLLESFELDHQFNAPKQTLFYKLYSAANID